METTIKDLEQQLSEQDDGAKSIIAQWQETVNALEASKAQLTESLQKANADQESAQKEVDVLQAKLTEMEDTLRSAQAQNTQAESLLESIASLERQLGERETRLTEANEKLADDEKVVGEWESK